MLDLIGKSYLIEHMIAFENQDQRQKSYEFYISELLRAANNSIAHTLGGAIFKLSWQEMLNYKPETRTSEEVISSISQKLKALEES